jgi:hypothetical protein
MTSPKIMKFPTEAGHETVKEPSRICATGLVILCLVLLLSSSLAAGSHRGFTGFYQARATSEGPLTVQVAVTIRIFNNTRSDVSAGALELRDSLPPHKVLGLFNPVSVNTRASVQVTHDFALSSAEYARWQNGGHPELTLVFRDADGNPQSQSVELVRGNVRIEE